MSENDIKAAENRLRERNAMAKEYLNRFNNTNFSPKYYVNSQNSNRQGEKSADKNVSPPKTEVHENSSAGKSPESMFRGENLHTQQNSNLNFIDEIFKNSQLTSLFNLDSDKLLIIAVIFVLYKEKADVKLLLALLYVML